ncbi:MAG: hypothetical protein ACLS69_01020 [Butyricicoccus sp.]
MFAILLGMTAMFLPTNIALGSLVGQANGDFFAAALPLTQSGLRTACGFVFAAVAALVELFCAVYSCSFMRKALAPRPAFCLPVLHCAASGDLLRAIGAFAAGCALLISPIFSTACGLLLSRIWQEVFICRSPCG